jgi:hypothetical protein
MSDYLELDTRVLEDARLFAEYDAIRTKAAG